MAEEPKPVVVIPKEEAVFRLDGNGVWHNAEGKFENRKIIDYFHSMIQKDEGGYFLEQEHEAYIEKVYFPYEETALFVFRVVDEDGLYLHLNTGERMELEPDRLFMKNDRLYVRLRDRIARFTERALMSLAGRIEEDGDRFALVLEGKRYPIADGD